MRVAGRLQTVGIALLRCPVSGSAELAAAGRLVILCSGALNDYERALPVLEKLGANSVYVGEGEDARVQKLLINLVVIGTMALIGEAVALGEELGVGVDRLMAAINASVIGSTFTRYKTDALVAEDFSPTASVSLVRKDLRLLLSLAEGAGVGLSVTEAVKDQYALSARNGDEAKDFSAVVQVPRASRLASSDA
jgi:3-hydroxyisobutyrate dehydrogenase-like beta-hydroxyacid dehydrogenase